MDLATLTAILLALLLVAVLWVGWQLRGREGEERGAHLENAVELLKAELLTRQSESLMQMRDSIDNANKTLNDRLAEGTVSLDRRMAVLGEIENRLGQLARQTDNIETIGKNIQSLSDLLRPPKTRGTVGELLLDNLLGQILPATMHQSQYQFTDGARVDAVVKVADRLLPIDAKFPLEAFERLRDHPEEPAHRKAFVQAFRKQTDEIAGKYIRPGEKTTDFALMYVPAEAVYYQLIADENQEAFQYALSRRVIPSSPGHLYAFLASVVAMYGEVAGLGAGLSTEHRRLKDGLKELAETADRLAAFHSKMDGSLRGLSGAFDRAKAELDRARSELEKLRAPWTETAGQDGTAEG